MNREYTIHTLLIYAYMQAFLTPGIAGAGTRPRIVHIDSEPAGYYIYHDKTRIRVSDFIDVLAPQERDLIVIDTSTIFSAAPPFLYVTTKNQLKKDFDKNIKISF